MLRFVICLGAYSIQYRGGQGRNICRPEKDIPQVQFTKTALEDGALKPTVFHFPCKEYIVP